MLADNRAALAAATRQRAHDTRERARAALRRLDQAGTPVTFTAVATEAQVSRSLLYRDCELRAEIDRLRPRALLGPLRPPAAERTTDASLQQRLDTALDDNRELRRQNQLLHDQLAVLLGQQRNETASAPHATRSIGPCH